MFPSKHEFIRICRLYIYNNLKKKKISGNNSLHTLLHIHNQDFSLTHNCTKNFSTPQKNKRNYIHPRQPSPSSELFGGMLALALLGPDAATLVPFGGPSGVIALAEPLECPLDLDELDALLARGLGHAARVLQRLLDYVLEDPREDRLSSRRQHVAMTPCENERGEEVSWRLFSELKARGWKEAE